MDNQKEIITIDHEIFNVEENFGEFKYQEELTSKLDSYSNDFNQEIINEIVVWKVNRYSKLPD